MRRRWPKRAPSDSQHMSEHLKGPSHYCSKHPAAPMCKKPLEGQMLWLASRPIQALRLPGVAMSLSQATRTSDLERQNAVKAARSCFRVPLAHHEAKQNGHGGQAKKHLNGSIVKHPANDNISTGPAALANRSIHFWPRSAASCRRSRPTDRARWDSRGNLGPK